MPLDVRQLVEALPEGAETELSPHEALHALLGKLATKPVPIGALHRFWSMGSLQAKIALGYLSYWVRSGYATKDENERRLNETHLAAAIKLLTGMSYLRGMMMKIGQALANCPPLVPDQFTKLLGQLHFDAPPMHFSLLREHLRNELGGDPEEVFSTFEERAFAAASLGQVHRATLPSGERVAVKIQYPNIARTIQSDLRNMMLILSPMRLSKDWDNIRWVWEDVRQMLEWETDYEREASFLMRARGLLQEQDKIVVPRVHESFSTKRVLTMEYLEGVHIDQYLARSPSQEERDRYGELLMRTSFHLAQAGRLWYADSHPGNYIFMPDGRLGMIDFGCCREFSDEEWDYYRELTRVAEHPGTEAFRRAIIRTVDLDPDQPQDPDYIALLSEVFLWHNEYLRCEGKYDFGDAVRFQRGLDLFSQAGKKRYFRSMPVNTWINRQLLGIRALLFRLGARVNVKTIAEEESPHLSD